MDVKLPNLGEGADSGTVVSILVKPGAPVKKGQNIIELETGKAVAPIPAPAAGTIGRIAVKEGDKLSVGQLILVIEGAEKGGGSAEGAPSPSPAPKAAAKAPAGRDSKRPARVSRRSAEPAEVDAEEGDTGESVEEVINENPAAGPYVRRVARDLGIDLRVISGSGRSGQVVLADLKAYVERLRRLAARPRSGSARPEAGAVERPAPVPIDFTQWGPVKREPLTPLRRVIAERMVESATRVPTVTQFDEADVTGMDALRRKHAAAYEAKGTRLTLTSLVLKAVATVLRKHPIFHASLDEAAGEIVYRESIHLGLAVDTEAGLLVPVIRDVDQKDILQISREVQDLGTRARERKLGLPEMQGGTFTISNQGGIGGGHFTPIINLPEVAILGLGRSAARAVVRNGEIVTRLMMPVALTYDHRLIDGGSAARFTVDLVAAFEGFREEEITL